MKAWVVGTAILLVATLSAGCGAMARHRVLSALFDGVPYPMEAVPAGEAQGAAPGTPAPRSVGYREHGPYAARMCSACHEAAATNALVVPAGELCARCHALSLSRKNIHGPLASGGCLVCHDPHSSRYGSLLVSESDTFCLHCHDASAVARIPGHEDTGQQCTGCHDAHMSDERFLLK
jgi:predicted CXXCH cytochrome family protein